MSSTPPPSIHFDPKTMIRQNWSIPESIVYYMAKNPSSLEVCEKLQRTCKYFFHVNPIIVVASLKYGKDRKEDDSDEEMDVEDDSGASNVSDISDSDDDSDDGMVESGIDASDDEEMDVRNDSDGEMDESEGHASDIYDDKEMEDGELETGDGDNVNDGAIQDIDNDDAVKADVAENKLTVCLGCDCEENGCCMEIDLKTFKSKIWVSSDIFIDNFKDIRSDLMPKLASLKFDRVSIFNSQISFDDLAAFCQSATVVSLLNFKAIHDDGKVIFLEEILDCIPKLCTLVYQFPDDASTISAKTAASMLKNFKFKHAILSPIPEAFNIESFCGSINKRRKLAFWMTFSNDISDAYKVRLDNFVDTVINEYPNFGLMIFYPGQDMEKHHVLRERYLEMM